MLGKVADECAVDRVITDPHDLRHNQATKRDAGARGYLHGNPDVALVECGDVADGRDVDTPEQLARFRAR